MFRRSSFKICAMCNEEFIAEKAIVCSTCRQRKAYKTFRPYHSEHPIKPHTKGIPTVFKETIHES